MRLPRVPCEGEAFEEMKYHIICGTINGAMCYVHRKDNGGYAAQPSAVGLHTAVLFEHRRDAENALDELPHGVAKKMSITALTPDDPTVPAEPNTFEAHGHTWTRHTPGDPMPCEPYASVRILTREELDGNYLDYVGPAIASVWSSKLDPAQQTIGWTRA